MKNEERVRWLSRLALLVVAIIWGSTLVVSKSTTGTIAPNLLIASRFLIAFVVLALVFMGRLRNLTKGYLVSGLVIGFCLFLAHSAQTLGVTEAQGDPGRSGFLSAAYCVIVPFLFWAVDRHRIGFVAFGEAKPADGIHAAAVAGFSWPDFLALLSGIFFAAHIVSVEKFSRGKDPVLITIMQFLFAGLFSSITVAIQEPNAIMEAQWDVAWKAVMYLAIVATALALLLQNLGQKHTDPNSASIILGTESIFCVVFGVWFYHEQVTPMLGVGFVLIFLAILISETKLRFLRSRRESAGGA